MSDAPGGVGWQVASDGRWYPEGFGPGDFSAAAPIGEYPVRIGVEFGSPTRQNRLSVAFRYLLVLPHLIAITLFTLAIAVVLVVGWTSALILGRLPSSLQRLFRSYVRYAAELNAYLLLLTSRYPRFRDVAAESPVTILLSSGRLNRVAVLFRLILALPAGIVSSCLSAGFAVSQVFVWLIVLVAGRTPRPLYEALAALLRFQIRYLGFVLMLTSAYPDRLFGDAPTKDSAAIGADIALLPGSALRPAPIVAQSPGRLVISAAAKWTLAVVVGLGALFSAGNEIAGLSRAQSPTVSPSLADLDTVFGVLQEELTQYQEQLTSCATDKACAALAAEVVPFVVEFEVAVPRLTPASW